MNVNEADQVATLAGMVLGGALFGIPLARRAVRRPGRRVRGLIGGADTTGSSTPLRTVAVRVASRRPRWVIPELLLLPAGLAVGQDTRSVVPVVLAAAAVVPAHRWRCRRRTAAEARRRSAAVIDLCAGLVAEIRSGATPESALQTLIARSTALRQDLGREPSARLAAARYGADVPAAFGLIAELPGGQGAAALAACWRISADSGTGLARGLDRLADALRAERSLMEEVAGELAGARTTVGLLALLPAFGLALGEALGARPLDVLLHTAAGLACLSAGAVLEVVGLAWTSRIVRTAEDAPGRTGGSSDPRRRVPRGTRAPDPSCGLSRRRPESPGRPGRGRRLQGVECVEAAR